MHSIPEPPWPPSVNALAPLPAVSQSAHDRPSPNDPILVNLRQHRELTGLLADSVEAIGQLAGEKLGGPMEGNIRRRLRLLMGEMNRFQAPHRDTEESVLFPHLLAGHPELAGALDSLGDDHILIFDQNRRVIDLLDRLDSKPELSPEDRAELLPSLRAFVEHVWRHTLVEETLVRGARPG